MRPLRCKEEGVSRAILFNLSGHGHFDMQAYSGLFRRQPVDQDMTRPNWRWRCPACRQ